MSNAESSGNEERFLYNRKKDTQVYFVPEKRQFRVSVEMQDHVHHLRLTMMVKHPSLKIDDIQCEMTGVPDPVCRDAQQCLDALIGKKVGSGLVKELNGDWNQHGCTHLKDLFHEACYCLTQSQDVHGKDELSQLFPGITEEQVYKIFFWFRPDIKNGCLRYTQDTPFMQRVRSTDMPEGAEKLKAMAKSQQKQ